MGAAPDQTSTASWRQMSMRQSHYWKKGLRPAHFKPTSEQIVPGVDRFANAGAQNVRNPGGSAFSSDGTAAARRTHGPSKISSAIISSPERTHGDLEAWRPTVGFRHARAS